jgi:Flp pilus assembly protein TadD
MTSTIRPLRAGALAAMFALLWSGSAFSSECRFERGAGPADRMVHIEACTLIIADGNQTKAAHIDALSTRGAYLFMLGDFAAAKDDMDRLLALDDKSFWGYMTRGRALIRLRQADRALTDFSRAVEINPDHADARYELGDALWRTSRFDQAIESFDRALALNPTHLNALRQRGIARAQISDFDAAISDLSAAIAGNSRDWEALWRRAAVFRALGDSRQALDDIDAALRIVPRGPVQMLELKANLLGNLQRYREAIAAIEAIMIHPGAANARGDWRFRRGLLLYADGDSQGARADLEAAHAYGGVRSILRLQLGLRRAGQMGVKITGRVDDETWDGFQLCARNPDCSRIVRASN